MPGASADVVVSRAEQFRAALSKTTWTVDGQEVGGVTFSAGVAVYPLNGSNGYELIQSADRSLFGAKTAGRDRIVVASGSPAEA